MPALCPRLFFAQRNSLQARLAVRSCSSVLLIRRGHEWISCGSLIRLRNGAGIRRLSLLSSSLLMHPPHALLCLLAEEICEDCRDCGVQLCRNALPRLNRAIERTCEWRILY